MPCRRPDCYSVCKAKDKEKVKWCRAENKKHVERMKQLGCKGTKCSTKSFAKTCRGGRGGWSGGGVPSGRSGDPNLSYNNFAEVNPPSDPNLSYNNFAEVNPPSDPVFNVTNTDPQQECWAGNNNCGLGYNADGTPKTESDPQPVPQEQWLGGGSVDCWGFDHVLPNGYKQNLDSTKVLAPDGSIQTNSEYCDNPPSSATDGNVGGGGSVDLSSELVLGDGFRWSDGYGGLCPDPPGGVLDPIPANYQVSLDGQRIRDGTGREQTLQQMCDAMATPTCTYSSEDNLMVFGLIDLSTLMVAVGLPPLPSLDQTICDYEKDSIIQGVIDTLEMMAGDDVSLLSGDLNPDFSSPDGVADSADATWDYFTKSSGLGVSDIAAAAIEFGRGNFDETVINLLEAIPMFGNLLGDAINTFPVLEKAMNAGLLGWMNRLSDDSKGIIIDAGIDIITTMASIPNPASPAVIPICAVVVSGIMFGRKQWDEAVFNILSLGIGPIASKIGKGVVFLKGKLGTLYNLLFKKEDGVLTALDDISSLGDAAVSWTSIQQAFGFILDLLQKFMMGVVDILRGPITDLATKHGLLDSSGKLTAAGQTAVDLAKTNLKAISGIYDWMNGNDMGIVGN